MKLCTKCKKVKALRYFCKDNASKDGKFYWCKECSYSHQQKAGRTKRGLVYSIYYGQTGSSKTRGHNPPRYTKQILYKWVTKQKHFNNLYTQWEKGGYSRWDRPSVDRLDDGKGYSLDNIRLTTWRQNKQKEHEDLKSGKIISTHTGVRRSTLKGKKIDEFISQNEAERQTGIRQAYISRVCTGERKSAGGYKWNFC